MAESHGGAHREGQFRNCSRTVTEPLSHLFPFFPQILYALYELIVVVLERGPLLSHPRPALFPPAERCGRRKKTRGKNRAKKDNDDKEWERHDNKVEYEGL